MKINGLFAGLTTVDIFYGIEDFPARNSKLFAEKTAIFAGGPAANAAVAFAHLSGGAQLISPIGKHALAEIIKRDLESVNVKINDPARDQNFSPVVSSIISSASNGDRTVIASPVSDVSLELSSVSEIIQNADILLIDGFYPELCIKAAEAARARKIPIVLDAGSEKECTEELLRLSTDVIASEKYRPLGIIEPEGVIQYILEQGADRAAVTRGDKPVYFSDGKEISTIDVAPAVVIDTLGAGDIFHGAYAFELLNTGMNFRAAIEFADKIASKSCRWFGTRRWMQSL